MFGRGCQALVIHFFPNTTTPMVQHHSRMDVYRERCCYSQTVAQVHASDVAVIQVYPFRGPPAQAKRRV